MAHNLCNWLWRLLIGGVLLLAVWGKWQQGISHLPAETIYDRIVAHSALRHYAILAVETTIGLWIISGVRLRWSSVAAGVLLAVFCALLTAELSRANPSNCGCGIREILPDGDPRMDLIFGLIRNALLLLGCAWLYLLGAKVAHGNT